MKVSKKIAVAPSVLKLGASGVGVSNLQTNLNTLHLACTVDGQFGPETQSAVIAFQGGHGLATDGVVGPLTGVAIVKALTSQITLPQTTDTSYMAWMRSHLYEAEVTGQAPTAFDQEIFSHTDYGSLDGVMEPGCAATACAALEETDFTSPHNAAAASFEDYGTECELGAGCIVVFQWASGEHHVTFCDHIVDASTVACLGGNQSHEVNVSVYSRKYIVATRMPVKKAA